MMIYMPAIGIFAYKNHDRLPAIAAIVMAAISSALFIFVLGLLTKWRCEIVLEKDDFKIFSLSKPRVIKWRDTSSFHTGGSANMQYIAHDDTKLTKSKFLAFGKFTVGGNSMMYARFGLRAEDFANLMNAWRERALAEDK